MKKFISLGLIAVASVYYALLPLIVAQAVTEPGLAGTDAPTSTIVSMIPMRITAYASVPDETSDHPFITADGSHVYNGEVASNILPFGSEIQIPALFGNEIFVVHDRMSKKIKNTIDIWMPSVQQAIDFGAQHTEVVVLGVSVSTSTQSLAIAN